VHGTSWSLLEPTAAILRLLAAVSIGAHANDAQRAPFAQGMVDHVQHQHTSRRCDYHILRKASFVTSFSRMTSANSRFSRAPFVSNSFSRLASDTLTPPNLLHQR
jgi:hypothetical protein